MSYVYNVYGTKQVQNATDTYNRVANSAPIYSDSSATTAAKSQADIYAQKYKNSVDSGYKSKYESTINDLARKYSKDEFSWNTDSSSEYQSANDKYKREGKIAQENTAAAYSSNTGGYSNSYAQAAGQKAYNNYMDSLAEQIPTLRENAKASWSEEQEKTLNQIGLLQNLDDTQYQRYRDKVSDNYDFMNYYENKYATSKGIDMSQFQNELAQWQSQMSAASSNLSNIRSLAESQYEHNTLSADAQANINSSRSQTDAYYAYLNKALKNS